MNPEYGQEGTRTRKRGIKRRRNKEGVDQKHEIWFHILSILPVKTLLVCRTVCKSWWIKIGRIKREIKSFPLFGLLLRSSSFGQTIDHQNQVNICYISITSKKTVHMQINSPDSLIVGSNYDMELLGNLCSEFGGLHVENSLQSCLVPSASVPFGSSGGTMTDTPDNMTGLIDNLFYDFGGLYVGNYFQGNKFFAVHRGLLLIVDEDGTYRVHNPITRKVFILPQSPVYKEYGANNGLLERTGFILKLYGPFRSLSQYLVVRLCRVSKKIEVYTSCTRRKWGVSSLNLDDDLMNACWCWENYVFCAGKRTFYFLTDKDRGVAVRIESRTDARAYALGLPPPVQEGFKNARIGACGGCLYISYYNVGGIWIWKHVDDGSTPTVDAWLPLLKISQAQVRSLLSCTSLARERLCKLMDGGDFVIIPMGFHPDTAIVFLRVKSLIFSYDMTNHTLDEIGEINDQVFEASTIALPYSPCLVSLEPVK